jgi:hypothetical protein
VLGKKKSKWNGRTKNTKEHNMHKEKNAIKKAHDSVTQNNENTQIYGRNDMTMQIRTPVFNSSLSPVILRVIFHQVSFRET